jgi:hypothetical protein
MSQKLYRAANIASSLSLEKKLYVSLLCSLLVMLSLALTVWPTSAQSPMPNGPIVSEPVTPYMVNVDVRTLPSVPAWQPGDPEYEQRRRVQRPPAQDAVPRIQPAPDPLLALQQNAPLPQALRDFSIPSLNIEGVPYTGVQPPDTIGEVGPNHYVQMVNSSVGTQVIILDKSGATLASFALDSLWTAGGNCASGHGDPIVLYDRLADRWLFSEFADTGNHLCVYVSQSPDPVSGGWYLYDFPTPDFPDYPKYAVWPDAYYVSSNESSPAAYALEREQMLLGNAATSQRFTASGLAGFGFQALIPSDMDGITPPPAGSPNYFMRHRDDEVHNAGSNDPSEDYLEIWEFHVDWDTPANSTFGPAFNIAVTEFDSDLCGLTSFFCFPQPGTTNTLDPLREVVMWRLQYRNFDSHETLVGNLVTDVDGTDHGGIRWFELRKSGAGSWSLYQEGTFAPDAAHRWMGSIAMDASGNIALGYSVSDATSIYPSIRYVGRLAGDPLGTMPQGEYSIIAGSASQTSGTRWGDYSSMNVDPVDGCTFWYTNEYIPAGGNWSTRIAAFKFPGCQLGASGTLSGTITSSASGNPIEGAVVQARSTGTYQATTGADGMYNMLLLTGTYTVTASAYGYQPATVSGVDIYSGTTTIVDMALAPTTMYTVEGVVSDTLAGWPLYAHISVSGDPVDPPAPYDSFWTDPVSGYYSVTLAGDITYTFDVEAWSPGYEAATRDVGPLTADAVEDFALQADPDACSAPGYGLAGVFLNEDFESWPLPAGWNIVNNGGDCVWQAGSTDGDSNETGGAGDYADADSDYCGSGTSMDTDLQTPILDLTGEPDPTLEFKSDMRWYENDEWDVDLSLDGGSTWPTNLLHREGQSYRGPETITVTLTGAGGQSNARLRFRYQGSYDYWWQVDEVRVYDAAAYGCAPLAGGLVVGNVYDDNTWLALNGAQVSNDSGEAITATATPDDPDVDDAFYLLFSPAGSHTFTATLTSYGADVDAVTVVLSDTVGHDFYLPAGRLDYDPTSYAVTLQMGMSTTLPYTLSNIGGLAAEFELIEVDGAGDVPWLSTDPISGTLPVMSDMLVDVTFDADMSNTPQPGVYYAQLEVEHDTPYVVPNLPLTLTVTRPDTWGRLQGTVSSLGYCDANPTALQGAEVLIQNGGTFTLTTDISGTYDYWMEQDTYTVTVSADDHISEVVTMVGVAAGMTTTLDFDLRSDEPCLDVAPLSMEATLIQGEAETQTLTLTNAGAGALEFMLKEGAEGFQPFMRAAGGPDAFGYTYADSDEPDGPAYQWVDISGSGTAVYLSDDASDGPFPIGFTFNYYGADQTELYASSNGFLSFGAGSASLSNQCPFPNSGTPNDIIALLWDDLDPGDTSDPLYYETFADCPYGAGACLVVQYDNYHHYPGGGTLAGTFEAILFESGSVLLQFQDAGGETGASSTTGIENVAGDDGLTYPDASSCNTAASLKDELAVCFAYPGESPDCSPSDIPWLSQDPITGTVSADSMLEVDVTFTAFPTITAGTHTGTLLVNSDDALNSEVSVPVTLTVVLPPPAWDKMVYVNGEMVGDIGSPIPVMSSDAIEIVDRVDITYTGNVTFTLVEEWDDSLELVGYELPAGSLSLMLPGTGVITDDNMLIWSVAGLPAGWNYVITKTFQVAEGAWDVDLLTETLTLKGAVTQPDPVVLTFEHIVNTPPVAVDDSYTTNQDTALTVSAPGVLDNDTDAELDPLTAVWDSGPSNGMVDLGANGSFVYTPTTGFSGVDSFAYYANDGSDDSNIATVMITVTAVTPCIEVTSVTLGVEPGPLYVGNAVSFSADIAPDDADKPYDYTVDYGDGTPLVTSSSSADPLALSHTYASSGTFDVVISVWNCDMTVEEAVSDTLPVDIEMSGYDIYLPIVAKQFSG